MTVQSSQSVHLGNSAKPVANSIADYLLQRLFMMALVVKSHKGKTIFDKNDKYR